MTQETTELITLIPSEGMHLRNKTTGAIAENKVYLGKNDSADNYEEVTEEAYQQWLKEQNAEVEEPELNE